MSKSKNKNRTGTSSGFPYGFFNQNLIFISSNGEVHPIKAYNVFLVSTTFLVLLLLLAAPGLFLCNERIIFNNSRLQLEISTSCLEILKLKNHKKNFISHLDSVSAKNIPHLPKKTITEKNTTKPVPAPVIPDINKDRIILARAESFQSPATETPVSIPVKDESTLQQIQRPLVVSIEKFNYIHNEDNSINIRFKLINTKSRSGRIAGFVFAVFNNHDTEIFTIPEAKLTQGQPTERQKGDPFSISNYKVVKLKTKTMTHDDNCSGVCVYIYGEDGELYIKKYFSINPKPILLSATFI